MTARPSLAGAALLLLLALKAGAQSEDLDWSCPDRPNCVSTRSGDQRHHVAPLRFQTSAEEARRHLLAVLQGMARCRVTRAEATIITAEFTSALLGFVDDVQLAIDPQHGLIDVRSASRTGYSDLGVNRRRVEEIRTRFAAAAGDGLRADQR